MLFLAKITLVWAMINSCAACCICALDLHCTDALVNAQPSQAPPTNSASVPHGTLQLCCSFFHAHNMYILCCDHHGLHTDTCFWILSISVCSLTCSLPEPLCQTAHFICAAMSAMHSTGTSRAVTIIHGIQIPVLGLLAFQNADSHAPWETQQGCVPCIQHIHLCM